MWFLKANLGSIMLIGLGAFMIYRAEAWNMLLGGGIASVSCGTVLIPLATVWGYFFMRAPLERAEAAPVVSDPLPSVVPTMNASADSMEHDTDQVQEQGPTLRRVLKLLDMVLFGYLLFGRAVVFLKIVCILLAGVLVILLALLIRSWWA